MSSGDGSEFDGLKEFADKQKATDAAAAAQKPVETPASAVPPPAPAAETKPASGETVPPPGETPALAKRKFKIPLKVAGEDLVEEFDEDDLDESKATDGRKRLIDHLQRSKDYDRPGGALDQRAARLAQENHTRYMLEQGWWVKQADGKVIENPKVAAVRQRMAQDEAQPPAPAAPGQQPAAPAAAQTPRQKRIAELAAKYDDPKAGVTSMEIREFQELVSDERLDAREAAKAATERETQERAEKLTGEEKATRDRAAVAQLAIDKTVKDLDELLRDPATGKVDPYDTDVATRVMRDTLLETRDWGKARDAVRQHAERHSARMKSKVPKIPAPTAPLPPPVHPAGQTGEPVKKDEGFDPENPFPAGGLAHYAKQGR